jgi:hypothetical protein
MKNLIIPGTLVPLITQYMVAESWVEGYKKITPGIVTKNNAVPCIRRCRDYFSHQ